MRYLFFCLAIFSSVASATLNSVDKAQMFEDNILFNPGFENGKQGWTTSYGGSGAFSIATSGSNLLTGGGSAYWDATASTQTFLNAGVAIPNGLKGRNGVMACKLMVPSGTATHTMEAYDGSTVLGSVTITSSATPVYQYNNFIFPSSGSVYIRFQAQADEPMIVIDDCFMGDASEVNLANVSQSNFIGSAYFASTASCNFSRSNTSLGAMTDTDCPGPTVDQNPGPGVIQTTDADLPRVTLNNLPPGRYRVSFEGNAGASGSTVMAFAINDGTNTRGRSAGFSTSGGNSGFFVEAVFEYTTAGNRSFELYASTTAATAVVYNDNTSGANYQTWFHIYRYPTSTEQAYKPDSSPASWAGYHGTTCAFARTNTAYGAFTADGTCTLTEQYNRNFGTVTTAGASLPGVIFTPPRIGRYLVCAVFQAQGAANDQIIGVRMTDGANVLASQLAKMPASASGQIHPMTLCSIYNASTVSSSTTISLEGKATSSSVTVTGNATDFAVAWTITGLDQPLPAPIIINSVTNSSSGVTRIEAAKLNCDAGSAITSQHGSWVSSIGNISTGACAVTLASSTFSSTPYCTATPATTGGFSTGLELNVDATSATAVSVDCEDDASSACTAFDFILQCVGAK